MAGEVATKVPVVGADPGVGPVPRGDGPFVQREGRVGDNFHRVRSEADAEAGAFRAGSFRTIEGEVTRSQTGGAITGLRVLGFGRQSEIRLAGGLGEISGGEGDGQTALAKTEGQFDGVGEAGAVGILDLKTVDHQFQGLLVGGGGKIDPLALAAGPEKALLF